jgi:hypothetical protein
MKLRYHLKSGDIGELVRLHGILYNDEFGFNKDL